MYRGGGNYVVPMLPRNTQMIANQQMFRRVQEMNEKAVMTEETLFQAYPPVSSEIMTGTLRRLMRALMQKGVMTRPITVPQLRSFLAGTALPQLIQKYDDDDMKKVLGQYRSLLLKRDSFGYELTRLTPEYLENLITLLNTDKAIPPIRADVEMKGVSTQTETEEEGGETGEREDIKAETGDGAVVDKVKGDDEEGEVIGKYDNIDDKSKEDVHELIDELKEELRKKYKEQDLEDYWSKTFPFTNSPHQHLKDLLQMKEHFESLPVKESEGDKEETSDDLKQKIEDLMTIYYADTFAAEEETKELYVDKVIESGNDKTKRKEVVRSLLKDAIKGMQMAKGEVLKTNILDEFQQKMENFLQDSEMNGDANTYYQHILKIDNVLPSMDEENFVLQTDVSKVGEDEGGPSNKNFPPQSTGEKKPSIGEKKLGQLIDNSDVLKPIKEDLPLSNKLLESINSGKDREEILKEIFKEVTEKFFKYTNRGIGQTKSHEYLESDKMQADALDYYNYLSEIDKILIDEPPVTPGGVDQTDLSPEGQESPKTPEQATTPSTAGQSDSPKTPPEQTPKKKKNPRPPKKIGSYQIFYSRLQDITNYIENYPDEEYSQFINARKLEFDLLKEMITKDNKDIFIHLSNFINNNHELPGYDNTTEKKRIELLEKIVSTQLGKNKTYPSGILNSLLQENVEYE